MDRKLVERRSETLRRFFSLFCDAYSREARKNFWSMYLKNEWFTLFSSQTLVRRLFVLGPGSLERRLKSFATIIQFLPRRGVAVAYLQRRQFQTEEYQNSKEIIEITLPRILPSDCILLTLRSSNVQALYRWGGQRFAMWNIFVRQFRRHMTAEDKRIPVSKTKKLSLSSWKTTSPKRWRLSTPAGSKPSSPQARRARITPYLHFFLIVIEFRQDFARFCQILKGSVLGCVEADFCE